MSTAQSDNHCIAAGLCCAEAWHLSGVHLSEVWTLSRVLLDNAECFDVVKGGQWWSRVVKGGQWWSGIDDKNPLCSGYGAKGLRWTAACTSSLHAHLPLPLLHKATRCVYSGQVLITSVKRIRPQLAYSVYRSDSSSLSPNSHLLSPFFQPATDSAVGGRGCGWRPPSAESANGGPPRSDSAVGGRRLQTAAAVCLWRNSAYGV